jgi:hypothetical protein
MSASTSSAIARCSPYLKKVIFKSAEAVGHAPEVPDTLYERTGLREPLDRAGGEGQDLGPLLAHRQRDHEPPEYVSKH